MIKKALGVLLILILAALAWMYQAGVATKHKEETISKLDKDEQQRVLKKLETKTSSTDSKELSRDLNNFSLSTKQVLQQHAASSIQKLIQKQTHTLVDCLEKDFCGMKRDEQKGYFDESEVGGAKNLRHQLRHLLALSKDNQIDDENIELPFIRLFALPNQDIKILAAELFLQKDSSKIDELIKNEEYFTAESRAQYYELLFRSVEKDSPLHATLITNLLQALHHEDSSLVLAILEKSEDFKLAENEYFEIIKESCGIKTNPEEKHNWKLVRYSLNQASIKNNYNLSVDTICR